MQTPTKPRVLTGLRANNALTIGNYLGAVLPMVNLVKKHKDTHDFFMFVPDLHSFTTPIDHRQLYESVINNVRFYVAAGAIDLAGDHTKTYRQSFVPAHSELTWILDCFTGIGEMNRMTQFKDKAGLQKFAQEFSDLLTKAGAYGEQAQTKLAELGKNIEPGDYKKAYKGMQDAYEQSLQQAQSLIAAIQNLQSHRTSESNASVGLFNYPVLMAADILLYQASYVPVGDDQTQHLEFTRDIAQRMNAKFGDLFTIPLAVPKQHEFFGRDQGLRIRDLQDPTKKMSKSDESGKGVIFLTDTPEAATKKIMGAATDSLGKVAYDFAKQPGISNLLQLLALLTNQEQAAVNAKYEGQTTYGPLKTDVAKAVAGFLAEFQAKHSQVKREDILAKLQKDESTARTIAGQTLLTVQKAVGLRA